MCNTGSPHLRGNDAVPEAKPQWNHQLNSSDRNRQGHMINCLIEGMKEVTVKPVNYDKVQELQQGHDEILQSSKGDWWRLLGSIQM